jgi:hypothetical protein
MKNTILTAAAIAMIVGVGLVHGSWTSRWRVPPALKAVAQRLEALPTEIGDWTVKDNYEMPPRELAMTGAVGYISRLYVHAGDGQSVNVLALTGLPGNIATHTPDACFPGAGYTLGGQQRFSRPYGEHERPAEFQTALAERGGTNPSLVRLFWSWRSTKGWSAPDDARWAFAAEPMLTKVYITREIVGPKVEPKLDPCTQFMDELLPLIDEAVAVTARPPQVASR